MSIMTTRKSTVMMPPAFMKSATRYPAGPMIRAFTWWVGIRKELDVAIATVRAKTAGLPPAPMAMFTASGTSSTVAPTFDMTRVKKVANTATAAWMTQIGMSPTTDRTCSAIHFAVPVVSTASPRGMSEASRKTVFQLTAW
jgi:hypothetical protein